MTYMLNSIYNENMQGNRYYFSIQGYSEIMLYNRKSILNIQKPFMFMKIVNRTYARYATMDHVEARVTAALLMRLFPRYTAIR